MGSISASNQAQAASAVCMHRQFEVQAEGSPAATALVHESTRLSYRSLNRRANQLAHLLIERGAGPETLVAVCMTRTPDLIVAMLAIQKAGAAYAPIDPAYPAERMAFTLEDSRAPLVLTQSALAPSLPAVAADVLSVDRLDAELARQPDVNPEGDDDPRRLAYVLFTSGSTGRPKGVAIAHESVAAMLAWARRMYGPDQCAGVLAATSVCFDLSVYEIFLPLTCGGAVILAENAIALRPGRTEVTLVNTVPSAMTELIRRGHVPETVRTVNLAGEPLRNDLVQDIYRQTRAEKVYNLYGPSEDTTYSTWALAPRDTNEEPSIGVAIDGTRAYTLDEALQPTASGEIGELCLAGAGLARGYLFRPELTAEKFIPDPFSELPGARMYRTGDLARPRADGQLDFLGRLDHQVKIRGFRIELGEIEVALRKHPAIADAAVIARALTPGGDKQLAAFTVFAPGAAAEPQALRDELARSLPDYMIPARFQPLDALPLTPNGKLDRKALARTPLEIAEADQTPLDTETERALAEIWREALGLDPATALGALGNFIGLGGHSLAAVRALSIIQRRFGVELNARDLLQKPILREQAQSIERAGRLGPANEPIERRPQEEDAPLSFAQERLWFLDQLEPESTAYHMPFAARLSGELDEDALARAVAAMTERHESLRARFPSKEGKPRQLSDVPAPPLATVDLRDAPPAKRQAEALRQTTSESLRPFDLSHGPLFEARLYRLDERDRVLLLRMHHIVADGMSLIVMIREISERYAAIRENRAPNLPEAPIHYADYARWSRQPARLSMIEKQLERWQDRLADAPPAIETPTDLPRPARRTFAGGERAEPLDGALVERLTQLSRARNATPFMALLALYAAFLSRYSGQRDLVIGTPIAGRDRPETAPLIGFFVNTLAIRVDATGAPSFYGLLDRVRDAALTAYADGDAPFEHVVERLNPDRDLSRPPLVQAIFALEDAEADPIAAAQPTPGLEWGHWPLDLGASMFELELYVQSIGGAWRTLWRYNRDLFTDETAARWAAHFLNLLRGAAAAPDLPVARVDILDSQERRRLVFEWNDTRRDFPANQCLHQLVEAWARKAPDAAAAAQDDRRLTYGALNRFANQLARRLRAAGATADRAVAIGATPSFETLAAIVATLKAGCAYLPLDPAYPKDRLRYMAAEAGADILLAPRGLSLEAGARRVLDVDLEDGVWPEPDHDLDLAWDPRQLALILFTSGTTGRPKGVMLNHRGVVNLALDRAQFELGPADCMMQIANMSFDAFTFELWPTMAAGASLRFIAKDILLNADALAAELANRGVTAGLITTALFNQLAAARPDLLARFHVVLFGGEKADVKAVRRVLAGGPPQWLINAYGPTEATTYATLYRANRLPDAAAEVPIGAPIANAEVHLLDHGLNPAPIGAPGELCIGGVGLARGYANRPDLTAERFTPHPFARDGARVYRTGDLARRLADGQIEYLGRADRQLKLRGHRIEPREIERLLQEHPMVDGAAVGVVAGEGGDRRLAAHVQVADAEPTADLGESLRRWLGERAPAYMVPAAIVTLDRFPLTPNGKLDRKALPKPRFTGAAAGEPPRTNAEKAVADVWRDILGLDAIGADDRFFEIGGHSLLAAQVAARLGERLGVAPPLQALFEKPRLADFAAHLEGLAASGEPEPATPEAATDAAHPQLSFAQERLWFLDRMDPDTPNYNAPFVIDLDGPLDIDALRRAIDEITARHEPLRARFALEDGRPVQTLAPPEPADFRALDFTEDDRGDLAERMLEENHRPFDLARGPLLRARLLRRPGRAATLHLNIHHIVFDGWSADVFFRELAALYGAFVDGRPSPLPPLARRYRDYAAWQRHTLRGPWLAKQLRYWEQALVEAPTLDLAVDFPRPAAQSFAGANAPFTIDPRLTAGLGALARAGGATPFMALTAAWAALLARYAGQRDICIGTPVANRGRAEFEDLIGLFVNTLALRVDLSGAPSFRELVERVRRFALAAFANADAPFEQVVEKLQPERDLSRTPLFQTILSLENEGVDQGANRRQVGGLSLRMGKADYRVAKFDILLTLTQRGDRLDGLFTYCAALFRPDTIHRMANGLLNLLRGALAEPDAPVAQIDILDADERRRVVETWNDTRRDYPSRTCLHQLLETRARRAPDGVAAALGDAVLTYGALNRRANQLARRLLTAGARRGQPIAVGGVQSFETLAAIVAALKCGAAYLPLDPAYPEERLRYMAEIAGAEILACKAGLFDADIGARETFAFDWNRDEPAGDDGDLDRPCDSGQAAVILFTSGTTGQPKGAMLTHRGVVNLAEDYRRFGITGRDCMMQIANMSFDAFAYELWLAIYHGAPLRFIPKETLLDAGAFAGDLARHRATTGLITTALFNQLAMQKPDLLAKASIVLFGGEKAEANAIRAINAGGAPRHLLNIYGPTEATTYVTFYRANELPDDAAEAPIGRPISNTAIHLLDPCMNPVPIGAPGELFIDGPGVASGYVNRPRLTAERFTPHPLAREPGARLYRTGDLARWLPNGMIAFVARIDRQIKLRGHRIEPREIEQQLREHPRVGDAIVRALAIGDGDRRLVAHVQIRGDRPDSLTELGEALRDWLGERLPAFLVPSAIVALVKFPLTPNGKVDRRALPEPELGAADDDGQQPLTGVALQLAEVWTQALGAPKVGARDNFFELGGHSLLAARAQARIHERFGVDLPLKTLFEKPVLADQARAIEALQAERAAPAEPPLRPRPQDGPAPLSFTQERLWFLHRLDPDSANYNIPLAYRLRGPLDRAALARALAALTARHEILRARYAQESERPVQIVDPPAAEPLACFDLSGFDGDREAELARRLEISAHRPFDLTIGPVCRFELYGLGDRDHALLVCVHHIAADGWSTGVLLREITALYRAAADDDAADLRQTLPPLPVQYADYAVWQRAWLRGPALQDQVAYWKTRLAGAPPLELPTDASRPPVQTHRGQTRAFALPDDVAAALADLRRTRGVTPFMTLLAAFALLLRRYSGQTDFCVGAPTANRNRAEVEGLIGFFVNTLALRFDLAGVDSFRELLDQTKQLTLEAYARQDAPFEQVVEAVRPPRDLSRSPLFQVLFTLEGEEAGVEETLELAPGLALAPQPYPYRVAKFDMSMALSMRGEALTGRLEYNVDLFHDDAADRMIDHYSALLANLLALPDAPLSQIAMTGEEERRDLVRRWNQTRIDYPFKPLTAFFEAQAARAPHAPALYFEDEVLSYAELNDRADRLARLLRQRGVGPEIPVGVCLRRSLALPTALYAILKAGGYYVPLDPDLPLERVAMMAADCAAPIILTRLAERAALPADASAALDIDALPEPGPAGSPTLAVEPGQAAYMIYTSGSTGRPKGVINAHAGIVNRLQWGRDATPLDAGDCVMQKTPFSFDVSVWELFWPLMTGAAMALARPDGHKEPTYLADLIERRAVTTIHFVPSMLQAFVELADPAQCGSLRRTICSGEALPNDLKERFLARFPGRLHNLYGPTETAVEVTWHACRPGGRQRTAPIGAPIANTQAHVIGPGLAVAPIGVPGELLIGGAQVSRGYAGRADLTAAQFIPDPFAEQPGLRLYRTGDLVRRLADGELDFLGRVDFQVKIRGFRIELGEIETALAALAEVAECAALAIAGSGGDAQLAAFVVPAAGAAVEPAELRRRLAVKLPPYMIPTMWAVLDAMPLTASGKLDRRALANRPELTGDRHAAEIDDTPPQTPVEQALTEIWAELLDLPKVGVETDFFEAGGHSLLAVRAISRVQTCLGASLPLRELFNNPTAHALAPRVEACLAHGSDAASPIEPAPRDQPLPLSYAQERLWFLDRMEPGGTAYHIPAAYRVEGRLDPAALQRGFTALAHRHQSLRVHFAESADGRPVQVIDPPSTFPIDCLDLRALPEDAREDAAHRAMIAAARAPFALDRGPLWRVSLYRTDDHVWTLLVNMHHIVSDGWSLNLLFRELEALYRADLAGVDAELPPHPLDYADFTAWQRRWLTGARLDAQLGYWEHALAGAPAALELPVDFPRPTRQTFAGDYIHFQVAPDTVAKLETLANRRRTTSFMTLLAGYAAFLCRYAGQSEVVIGAPVANRGRTELEGMIGFFVNTLALRINLADSPSLAELFDQIRTASLEAYAHQEAPFERVVDRLQPERDLRRTPLFQTLFSLEPETAEDLDVRWPGLRLRSHDFGYTVAKFELSLYFIERPDGLRGSLSYNTALFKRETADRMARCFQNLLAAAADEPDRPLDQLDLLGAGERRRLTVDWNQTRVAYPAAGHWLELFEARAQAAPDHPALIQGERTLSYAELDRRAARLGARLASLGVGLETTVGVALERSFELIESLLAIFKAGGAYLPIDPTYPESRVGYMIADAGPRVLITRRDALPFAPDADRILYLDEPDDDLDRPRLAKPVARDAAALAYVIYTSGSTGQPKGVGVTQGSLLNHARAIAAGFRLQPSDRMLLFSSVSFDMSVRQIFPALGAGSGLVLLKSRYGLTVDEAQTLIARQGVTTMVLPAAFWHQWTQDLYQRGLAPPPSLRLVNTGGEQANPAVWKLWNRLTGGRAPWVNTYGPTEGTVTATWFAAATGETPAELLDRLPIGKPIPNFRIYLLDRRLNPVPIGVSGELFIAGVGVARGYLGRPAATADTFTPDPFVEDEPGARMYRTGDAARYLASGDIEFIGRVDRQVKLRGFRIELGEIEHRVRRLAPVREAVVTLAGDPATDQILAAYMTLRDGEAADETALRQALAEDLPDYMVPAAFVFLDAFPLNPSGKIDLKALPAPDAAADPDDGWQRPHTPTQETLALIWTQLLPVSRVGLDDRFFELGGHSLLATRAASRIRDLFGVSLPLKTLFEKPGLAEQATAIDEALRGQTGGPEPPMRPREDDGPAPLSFAQERMWFLNQLDPDSPTYNIPKRVRLAGALDAAALERSFTRVAGRHDALRARFTAPQGRPCQTIDAEVRTSLAYIDLAGLAPETAASLAKDLALAASRRPFDLERGPLWRVALLRLGEGAAELLYVMHHIVSDGWSATILIHELAAFYTQETGGAAARLPELPVQYADYAAWQRAWLRGEARETQLAFWERALRGAPASVDLPTDKPRPAVRRANGDERRYPFPNDVAAKLESLCRERGVTPFMALLAAFGALLARYSGQTDLCIGTPIANRTRRPIEDLIGFFVNTLALRLDLSPDQSFDQLLAQTRAVSLNAYANQDVPFEQVVERLSPERDLSRTPLFQTFFTHVNEDAAARGLSLPGLRAEAADDAYGAARFDLSLLTARDGDRLLAVFEYSTDLFFADAIDRLARHFQTLAANALDAPHTPLDRIPMTDAAERRQLIAGWNQTEAELPTRPLTAFVAARAAQSPTATALWFEGEALDYAAFDRRVNRLAQLLRRRGVGPETAVGVCMTRSFELVVALYAVIRAGGYYTPLDPDLPPARLAFMAADCGAPLILTQRAHRNRLPTGATVLEIETQAEALDAMPTDPPDDVDADLGQAAYMIYTSGSTGQPKGVVNSHAGIVNRLLAIDAAIELGPGDCAVQKTPFSFDVSLWELFWPLMAGAELAIAKPGGHKDPLYLTDLIAERGATAVHFVPSMLQAFLELTDPARCASLKRVFCSGEALPFILKERFFSLFDAELHNLYGPTEAAVEVSWHACAPGGERQTVPIGAATANTRLYTVDRHFEPTPVGAPGELLIAGVQVARGYAGQPALTAERFAPDPFADAKPGLRLYRTGDLARRLPNGEIEFMGRLDFQVKIRGFRIELGEIEAALRKLDEVAEAAAVVRHAASGDPRIAAYLVERAPLEADAVKRALAESLPPYMIPDALVKLEAMPLTASGKLDRKALPAPDFADAAKNRPYAAPQTETEHGLAEIWRDLLGREQVGRHDHFFDLGGHSLLAARVVAHARARFAVDLPLRDLFANPFLEELAAAIDRLGTCEPAVSAPIPTADRSQTLPLSFAQERLWFLDRYDPESIAYHVPFAFRLHGHLRRRALKRAHAALIARHESLRARFAADDEQPVQIIEPPPTSPLTVADLSGEPNPEAALCQRLAALARQPFDLARGSLFRAVLYRLGPRDHALQWVMHHIAVDGWSLALMVREFGELYRAACQDREPDLPRLPIQYADYAVWQRERLSGQVLTDLLDYWTETLAGVSPLDLPIDHPRPADQAYDAGVHRFIAPAAVADRLDALCRRWNATPFMGLLAAFAVLAARYARQDDFAVATPIANRGRAETENLVGFFTNTLALRQRVLVDESFAQLTARTRDAALEAFARQEAPFEQVVDRLQPERDTTRPPICQVMFSLEVLGVDGVERQLDLPELEATPLDDGLHTVKFDLTLFLSRQADGLHGELAYNAVLFLPETAARMATHFGNLLAGLTAEPDQPLGRIAMIDADEREDLIRRWNQTDVDCPSRPLTAFFEARARQNPDAPALFFEGQSLSYGEMRARVHRLATGLRRRGVGAETPVGVCMTRSFELVLALYAVSVAGGCYTPLDPELPAERLAFMAGDCGAPLVLTQAACPVALPSEIETVELDALDAPDAVELGPPAEPGQAAYMIYTSGSTGRPKGVVNAHAGIVNRLLWMQEAYRLDAGDCVMQKTPFSFDVSVWEFFWPLMTGASLAIARPEGHKDPAYLTELIERHSATTIHFVPSMLQVFLETADPGRCGSLRRVICSGEALPAPLVERFFQSFEAELHNLYGPTEAAVDVTHFPCAPNDGRTAIPIGHPVNNVHIHLVDPASEPIPIGVPGELLIGGVQTARGYAGRPALTAERFTPDPFVGIAGARLYRTGDLARRLADGSLEFIGRLDFQVKIRGFRIELGEIESALRNQPGVSEAAVLAREARPGDWRLIAYLTGEPDVALLREALAHRLPTYMVPAHWVTLKTMPLSPSGKLDRKALPAPDFAAARAHAYIAPRDEREAALAEIWSELLGVSPIGVQDRFFELGGHSLMATRLASRIWKRFHVEIPIRDLFEHATIESQARYLDLLQWTLSQDQPEDADLDEELI